LVAAVGLLLLVGLIFVGCSDDSTIIITSPGTSEASSSLIEQMFPTQVGFRTIFKVTQANGQSEIVTNTVGEEVLFGYTTAHSLSVRSSSGESYVTYFMFSDSALFFSDNWQKTPEKVLSVPLTVGSIWYKNDTYIPTDDGGTTDGGTTNDGTTGETALKTLPGNAAGLFTIEGVEGLSLSNGQSLSGTIRVRNDGAEMTNYYWFTQGIGLVRWVLDANPTDHYDGAEVGELLEYGVTTY
jgi:hypothetical protein